jgi:hypothetical protein
VEAGQPTLEPAGGEGGVDLGVVGARGLAPEAHVVGHGEVVVEPRAVAEETDAAPEGPGLVAVAKVVAQHGGGAPHHREQAGQAAQERGLAGAVRSAQEHDLSGGDLEVDARQRGEPTKQGDRPAELDDGFHEGRPRVLTGARKAAIEGAAASWWGVTGE